MRLQANLLFSDDLQVNAYSRMTPSRAEIFLQSNGQLQITAGKCGV